MLTSLTSITQRNAGRRLLSTTRVLKMSAMDTSKYEVAHLSGFYSWTDTLTGVYYGPGCTVNALPKLLDTLGAKKALVVTGKSLYTKTDVVQRVESILNSRNAHGETFYGIGEHSPIAGIRAGADAFRRCGADVIVALGGGSPVDASKAIIYYLQQEDKGDFARQIAIPTTLSAAEYSIGAGYTDEDGKKIAVSHPHLAPAGIILDAELTLPTPERLWLSTGIRSLDHTVETLYRPLVPVPVKALCYAALRDLFRYLPASKANPSDVAIRQRLQIASWMSLWPLKLEKYSALGLSHALGHKLGAAYSIPHGITSCITLAPVVNIMADIGSQQDKECIAEILFYVREESTGSLDGDVKKVSSLIDSLIKDLGLQSSLKGTKVPVEDCASIAEQAMGNRDSPHYPKVVKLLEGLY